MRTYEEEGRTDWALALSKIFWFFICLAAPFSLFRFLNDLFGTFIASGGILLLLLIVRLNGPMNLVLLDELLVRIFPELRSAYRFGRIRVYDFRVTRDNGEEVSCLLRGELRGSAPMPGDSVTLNGYYRFGSLRVTNGRNEATRALILPRPNYSGWILVGTMLLLALFVLYLDGMFDEWLYPLIVSWLEPWLNEL
jgi:hypothetical protein